MILNIFIEKKGKKRMNTTEKKTTKDIIWDAVNTLSSAAWDLRIVENTLVTGNENELIVIPNVDNDPLRLALLALRAVRTELEDQEDTLTAYLHESEREEGKQTIKN